MPISFTASLPFEIFNATSCDRKPYKLILLTDYRPLQNHIQIANHIDEENVSNRNSRSIRKSINGNTVYKSRCVLR